MQEQSSSNNKYEQYCDTSAAQGENVRYNHLECGDRRGRLYVKRNSKGWVLYCHNCEWKWFQPIKQYTASQIKELFATRSAIGLNNDKVVRLPAGVRPLNSKEKAWFYKYGITDEEISLYKFCYSDAQERIIMPVYHGEELRLFQGRGTDPKYITTGKRECFIANKNAGRICLVEDIVSAVKVGRYVCGCAILGSYIGDTVINLLKNKSKVFIWLDYDKKTSALKYARRITQLSGTPCKIIITPKDPKEYSDLDIQKNLC